MKGAFMNKAMFTEPFVYAPKTYNKLGAYGVLAVIAFFTMIFAIYAPDTKVIGTGLNYDLVP